MRTAVISVSVLRLRTTSMHSYIRFPAKGQGRNARTWTVSSIHGQLEVGQFTPSRLGQDKGDSISGKFKGCYRDGRNCNMPFREEYTSGPSKQ